MQTERAALEEACRKSVSELTRPRDFGITLTCPDCGSRLSDYFCIECSAMRTPTRMWSLIGESALVVVVKIIGFFLPIFLGIIGEIVGRAIGFAKYPFPVIHVGWGGLIGFLVGVASARLTIVDLIRELEQKRALSSPVLDFAAKFRRTPKTYDLAAFLYYRWVISISALKSPPGFVHFLRCYRRSTTANIDLRNALFDAVLVQALARLGVNDPDFKWLVDAVYTGSKKQKSVIETFVKWKLSSANSIYSIEPVIHEIDQSYSAGTDTRGSDLTLPVPALLLEDIANRQSGQRSAEDLYLRAARSKGYSEEIAEELKSLDLANAQRLAQKIRTQSEPLATSLGDQLDTDKTRRPFPIVVVIFIILLNPVVWFVYGGLWDCLNHGKWALGTLVLSAFSAYVLIAVVLFRNANLKRQGYQMLVDILLGKSQNGQGRKLRPQEALGGSLSGG